MSTYKARRLDQRTVSVVAIQDLCRTTKWSDTVVPNFLEHDGCNSIVTNPTMPKRIAINLLYDIPLAVCVPETGRVDSPTLLKWASKRFRKRYVGAFDGVGSRSTDAVETGVRVRGGAIIHNEGTVILETSQQRPNYPPVTESPKHFISDT